MIRILTLPFRLLFALVKLPVLLVVKLLKLVLTLLWLIPKTLLRVVWFVPKMLFKSIRGVGLVGILGLVVGGAIGYFMAQQRKGTSTST